MEHIEIFTDLDHCIFDTDLFFWTDVREFLNSRGITTEAIIETYFQIQTNGYALVRHLEQLADYGAVDRERIAAILEDFNLVFTDLSKYLFADSADFLANAASRQGEVPVLLSFGQKSWQEMKITRAGIFNYFSHIIYAARENSKGEAIREFCYDRSPIIVAIDNSPKELDSIKDKVPQANTFLLAPRLPRDFFMLQALLNNKLFFESRRYVIMEPRHKHRKIYSLIEASYEIAKLAKEDNNVSK